MFSGEKASQSHCLSVTNGVERWEAGDTCVCWLIMNMMKMDNTLPCLKPCSQLGSDYCGNWDPWRLPLEILMMRLSRLKCR